MSASHLQSPNLSSPNDPSLLTHLSFDGHSYTRLATPPTPLTTLSFHLYPTTPPTPHTTTRHNTVLLTLTTTSPSPAVFTLALRSYDRRLVWTLDDEDQPDTLTISASQQPIREYCWSTVQLDCSLVAGFRLAVVDCAGRVDVSSGEPDRLSAPSTALHTPLMCSSLHVAGSPAPAHKPTQYFTGHIAALSLSPLSQLPPHPVHPRNTRLPPLPTRSLPLYSFAALFSTPPFSPLTIPPPSHPHLTPTHQSPHPPVLACHDLRGGYTDDWHCQSMQHGIGGIGTATTTTSAYTFQHWAHIDTLVYFSHVRVTIPPSAWIVAAHKEGVRILGTIITEWDEGREETVELVTRGGGVEYAKSLVRLCEYYGFDGWLINIESPLLPALIPSFIHFLATLRQLLHASPRIRRPQLIWYDSISAQSGQINYQSHLHPTHTLPFFHAVDALFSDYHWTPPLPTQSALTAGPLRTRDVLTGVDVWGRGTYRGGGWAVREAMDEADKAGTGVALFGCGWTLEGLGLMGDRRRWERTERRFWLGEDVIEIDVHGSGVWNSVEEAMAGWQRSKLDVVDDAKDGGQPTQQAESRDRDWDSDEDWLKGWALVDDDQKGKVLVTSHRWCRRWREIDLYAYGITPAMLAASPLFLTHSYRGSPPNTADQYHLHVTFLSTSRVKLAASMPVRREVCGDEWRTVSMEMPCHLIRYVVWEEGGRDAEGWAGHYGCRLGRGKIEIAVGGAREKAVGRPERRRKLPLQLPLLCSFNVGSGSNRWRGGRRLRHESQPLQPGEERHADVGQYGVMEEEKRKARVGGEWSNLHEQDVQTYLRDALRAGETKQFMTAELCEDVAFEGGRSLCFTVRPNIVDGAETREFDVLQFDSSAAPTQPSTDLILRLFFKEADGVVLRPFIRRHSGQLLDLEDISQTTWGNVPGTGWSHKVFLFSHSPPDIAAIVIQPRTWWPRTEHTGVKNYLGQIALSTLGHDCPMCTHLEEGGFAIASLIAWHLPSPSLTTGLYTVYLAWLPPMLELPAYGGRLGFAQFITYEVEVDGVYVGNTKRCLYAMEGVSEKRLREGRWSVRCMLSNGDRQVGPLPSVSALMLDTDRQDGETDEREEERDAREERKQQMDGTTDPRARDGSGGQKARRRPLPPLVINLVDEHCQQAGLVGEHGDAIKRQLLAHIQL